MPVVAADAGPGSACRPRRVCFQATAGGPSMPPNSSPCAGTPTAPSTGRPVPDQADIDGELVAHRRELARAVQRVDQPVFVARLRRDAGLDLLLGDHRDVRRGRAQAARRSALRPRGRPRSPGCGRPCAASRSRGRARPGSPRPRAGRGRRRARAALHRPWPRCSRARRAWLWSPARPRKESHDRRSNSRPPPCPSEGALALLAVEGCGAGRPVGGGGRGLRRRDRGARPRPPSSPARRARPAPCSAPGAGLQRGRADRPGQGGGPHAARHGGGRRARRGRARQGSARPRSPPTACPPSHAAHAALGAAPAQLPLRPLPHQGGRRRQAEARHARPCSTDDPDGRARGLAGAGRHRPAAPSSPAT